MALSAENRLNKKKDYDTVFKEGKAIKGSFLFIKVAGNNSQNSRFGFVVSSKVSGKAVVRNRIRRGLSDFIRTNINKIKPGYDIIVIVKNGAVGVDKLKNDVEDTLKRAKLYYEKPGH